MNRSFYMETEKFVPLIKGSVCRLYISSTNTSSVCVCVILMFRPIVRDAICFIYFNTKKCNKLPTQTEGGKDAFEDYAWVLGSPNVS